MGMVLRASERDQELHEAEGGVKERGLNRR